ncbi:MAG: hypothetical protein R6W73_05425 [Candidatus Saliniplasma sp.]
MGEEVTRAFDKRQLGDYEYTFEISDHEAEDLNESAKKFVNEVTLYLEKKRLFVK